MNNGIPIDDSAAMAGNLVKAVEDIAVAVGSASDVFGRSFGEFANQFKMSMSGVTDSVKTLQNEMVDVIKSLDVNIKVIRNIKMPTVAAPKPPKPPTVKEQDPVIQKAKQDMALNSLAISELKLKSAREKQASDIQKKEVAKQNADARAIAKEQKEKLAKEKKQALLPVPEIIKAISDPMQAIANGVGHFFDMAEKRAMLTVAQGLSGEEKKGKKEKTFSMDMGLLATANKPAGPGVDIPKNLLTGLTDSAAAWNDVFANATKLSQEMATRFSIIGTTQPKQTEQFDPGTTYRQNVLLYEVLDRPRNQEEGTQNQEYNAGEIYSVLGNIGNLEISNQAQIASLMEDVRSMLGDATDQAQALALEMQAAFDPRTYVEQAQDAIDGLGESVSQQAVEVTSVLENLFYDIAEEASNASQAAAASRTIPTTGQMYQGGYASLGIAQNYVPPSAAPQVYQGGQAIPLARNYVPQNIAPPVYEGGQGVPLAAQPAPPPPGGNRVVQVGPNGASDVAQANNTAQILQSTAAFASLHNASINVGNSFNQFPSLFNQITSGIGAKGGLGGLGGQAFQTLGGMFSGGGYGGGGGGAAGGAAGGAGRRLGTAAAANPLSAAIVAPFAAAIAGGAAIMASFNAIVSTSNSIMSMFGGMISKVAPALTMQFQIVANDLEAVVGRGLIPMFMRLTEAQRTMADAMVPVATATTDLYEGFGKMYKIIVEAVMPLYQAVVGLLAPAFSYIVSLLNDFLDGLKPIINVFSGLINVVTYVLTGFFNFIKIFDIISIIFKAFSDGMKYIFGGLIIGFGKLLEWMSYIPGLGGLKKASENVKRFGMDTFAGNAAGVQKGASVGAAVREVGSTSIEGIGDEIRKASLMIQIPEGEKQKEQIDYLKDIAENTSNLLKKPGEKVDIHTVERPPEPAAPNKPYLGGNYMMPGGVH